jgi:O-antigen/teichoic acid export membrane protein
VASSETQKILGRMTFLTAANLLGAGLGFLAVVVIARHYGATGLGLISLTLTLVAIGRTVSRFGTSQYGVRQVAAGIEAPEKVVGNVIVLRLIAAVVSFLLLLALPYTSDRLQETQALLAIFSTLVFITAFRLDWLCQAFHRVHVYGVIQVSIQGLYLLLVAAAAAWSMQIWVVAASQVLAELVVVIVLYAWVSRNLARPDFRFNGRELANLARESAPITGTQLLRSLCLPSDIILLGLLVSATDLGFYSAAFRIFLFCTSLITAYFVIMLPRFAAHANAPPEAMAGELRDSLRRSLPLLAAGSALLALLADPLLAFLFGAEYTVASVPLRLLCLALVFNLLNRTYRQVLLAAGRQRQDFRLTITGTLVHVGAKLALIPLLGIAGAALGSVIGELFLYLVLSRAARPALGTQR